MKWRVQADLVFDCVVEVECDDRHDVYEKIADNDYKIIEREDRSCSIQWVGRPMPVDE